MPEHKDSACATCMHRIVCMHKDKFSRALNAVNDVTVHLENGSMIRLRDIPWIKPVGLRCDYYDYDKGVTLR